MKRLCLFLMLAAAGSAEETVRVGLVVSECGRMSPQLQELWMEEVERLLPLEGVEWHWRTTAAPGVEDWFHLNIVIRVTGQCRPGLSSLPEVTPGPLGTCGYCDGEVLPFVTLYCDRVLHQVRRALPYPAYYQPVWFIRALARVTAHELYHTLSGRREHHEEGLAKALLSDRDLTHSDAAFTPVALEQIRQGIRGQVLPAETVKAEAQ